MDMKFQRQKIHMLQFMILHLILSIIVVQIVQKVLRKMVALLFVQLQQY